VTFAIVAELPLGTYRGAGQDGRPEPLPSVARLHAALLCAAGFGPRAVPRGDILAPCEADEVALRWLEEHPPDGVVIPQLIVNRGRAVAYRDDGTVKKTPTAMTIKKLPKSPDASVAVNGQFVWVWREEPPPPVRAALEALCAEVAYLGTTESPVRLRTAAGNEVPTPTHDLDPSAGLFSVGSVAVAAPMPGRTAELMAAHERTIGTPPSMREDKIKSDEKSLSAVPPRERVGTRRYMRRNAVYAQAPWEQVILLPLDRAIPECYRVKWAVAAHRGLIRLIGEGAPPLVTGAYPPAVRRPSNRLALHFLDPSMPVAVDSDAPATLAILVPAGTDAADMEVLSEAVSSLTSLRGPGGWFVRVTGEPTVVAGARMWAEPEVGHIRLWRTSPAAVPDTRGVRGSDWTFAHAALLSLGFVWKDQLPAVAGRQDEYYRNLARAVTETGAAVVHVRALRVTNVGDYVHRVNEHAVVRPYIAHLWLGDLATPTTIAAIGQSRHLGGGLLVPVDVPEQTSSNEITFPEHAQLKRGNGRAW